TQGVDYYEMGKEAGRLAVEILKNNKKPSEIKYKTMKLGDIVVNSKTLEKLGIKLPEEIESKLKMID
ncbi:MAG: ABC transporter substrate binding protein, partial [Leptotrichiaceae bacterium]|nr:ABC transporter substrate binding protein [Leptotrichiaceae bacterium]